MATSRLCISQLHQSLFKFWHHMLNNSFLIGLGSNGKKIKSGYISVWSHKISDGYFCETAPYFMFLLLFIMGYKTFSFSVRADSVELFMMHTSVLAQQPHFPFVFLSWGSLLALYKFQLLQLVNVRSRDSVKFKWIVV